jgi:hypothetical protein
MRPPDNHNNNDDDDDGKNDDNFVMVRTYRRCMHISSLYIHVNIYISTYTSMHPCGYTTVIKTIYIYIYVYMYIYIYVYMNLTCQTKGSEGTTNNTLCMPSELS